jgi:hypothetical protein
MTIDPTKPVKLLRLIDDNEDAYYPGTYQPGELPSKYLIPGVVTQENELPPGVVMGYNDLIRTQSMHMSAVVPVQSQHSYGAPPPPVVSIDRPSTLPLATDTQGKIEINTAALDRLIPVFGAIASNLLTEKRVEKAFVNLADLKKRVVVEGHDWERFSDRLLF